jgi:hypothetical protein
MHNGHTMHQWSVVAAVPPVLLQAAHTVSDRNCHELTLNAAYNERE